MPPAGGKFLPRQAANFSLDRRQIALRQAAADFYRRKILVKIHAAKNNSRITYAMRSFDV